MALDRVSAVVHMPPAQSRAQRAQSHGLSVGETLRLALTEADGADLLVSADNGRALRLTGLGQYGEGLKEGDVLLVRVLATDPLELELFGTATRTQVAAAATSRRMPLTDQDAMRLDQTALRRITWREPSAAALAATWRALVHGRWRSDAVGLSPDGPAYGARMLGPVNEPGVALPDDIERWSFPLYAWGGQPMLLRLVQSDPEEDGRPAARRARMLAIRVECTLPGVGAVMLHVQWVSGGIQLSIAAERADAIAIVRERLSHIAAALARVDLRLFRCSIAQGQLPAPTAPRFALMPRSAPAAVAPALYRAAAEVLLVLADLNPASR
uniref:Flagellar hook-length control protein FliK n=1 Tax=Sphingomonas sp. A1 TaxID=90322 RepID=A0A0F7R5X5_9SPHN|nr:hypothetical protein [Sphingomonas sp. A1]